MLLIFLGYSCSNIRVFAGKHQLPGLFSTLNVKRRIRGDYLLNVALYGFQGAA
jgi:hypothetical protein